MFFFGPDQSNDIASPFGAHHSKRSAKLSDQWHTLASEHLEGKRTVLATATQWTVLEDQLIEIITTFAVSMANKLPMVLSRIYAAPHENGLNKIAGLSYETIHLLAWIDGGDESWLSLVYPAEVIVGAIKLVQSLHQKTLCPAQSTSSHQSSQPRKNTRSSKGTGSIVGSNYFAVPTPPAPASATSSLPSSAQQALLEAPVTGPRYEANLVVDLGVPQLAELARDKKLTNEAQRNLAHAKAAYLCIQAHATGMTMFEKLHQHHMDIANQKQQQALQVVMSRAHDLYLFSRGLHAV
ncbi:hypothetical protein RhiJN_13936 [Ceratobasidium sp. AG-Ba]|nr:hypothetical protein RhiJN_13936 [Ceratobasidium sp. AG-Ba]